MVNVRCGALVTFAGSGTAGVPCAVDPVDVGAVALADGEGVAAGFCSGGGGMGKRKFHSISIAEEISNASKSRFCCICC